MQFIFPDLTTTCYKPHGVVALGIDIGTKLNFSENLSSQLSYSILPSQYMLLPPRSPMPPSRRDDLIDAAMRVFYRNGFHGTGLDMILQEGGISRMTLYNHFKSKDELIVAALRRRDEIFRNRMMKYVEKAANDPIDRIFAIFDFHEEWFEESAFCGCMFINAAAEFVDPQSPFRRVSADHKFEVRRYILQHCEAAHLRNPASLSEHISILLDGAIVTAQVVGQVGMNGAKPADAAKRAKEVARIIISLAEDQT